METLIPEWTLADRLRKARETACLDQQELASRIGVATTQVYIRVPMDDLRAAVRAAS